MHDIKDARFKPGKERSKTSAHPVKPPTVDDDANDDDDDDEDLEKELQSMYNWRQKRS